MKLTFIQKLLISVLTIPYLFLIIGSKQLPENSQKQDVKFVGLTKTLTNLLKTRTPKSFIIGDYEISMEDLIDTDITSLFDCDSIINSYLSEAGDGASYEMLSDVIKNRIWDRFDIDDGNLFITVSSDSTSEGFYINISIYRDRPVSIPIVLNASDTSFSTSFDTTCTVKFESDIDLFINAGKVNSGSEGEGVRIRINMFSFELTSDSEDEEQTDDSDNQNYESGDSSRYVPKLKGTIPFYLEGKKYSAAASSIAIDAISYWYLTPPNVTDFINDEDEACYTLSYKQLGDGQFKWSNPCLGSISASLIMIPAEEKWDSLAFEEKSSEFSYYVDNLFDDEGFEQISLYMKNLQIINNDVTVRNKKFVLK